MTVGKSPRCKAMIYSRSSLMSNSGRRSCTRPGTRPGGFCYSHDPTVIQAREDRARQTKLDQEARRSQHARKLLLIPILGLATQRRGKMENETARLGATAIIQILENGIRGESTNA